jgi:hypothetical protein
MARNHAQKQEERKQFNSHGGDFIFVKISKMVVCAKQQNGFRKDSLFGRRLHFWR